MILITEFMAESAISELAETFAIKYEPTLADDPQSIKRQLAGVKALIVRNRTKVNADLLAATTELLCIGRLGVGLDNIDLASCEQRAIKVFPATGANSLSVAEYVITAALLLLRGAYHSNSQMLAGAWPREHCTGSEIAGKQLGLVGLGTTARATANLARALGMRVAASDPFIANADAVWQDIQPLALDNLLAHSDVVSIHVPLTDATAGIIDSSKLALMKPSGILINVARGGIVDEAAMAAALSAGRLAGAALDVFQQEPLSANVAARFGKIPNLILTPHIAGVTRESNLRVSNMIARKIKDFLLKTST